MGQLELSQIQIANLNMLILVGECIKLDTASACSRFGLDADQAEFIASLRYQEIMVLVAHLGDECLFPPRTDLIQVLSWPPQLASAMLLAHPLHPGRPASQPEATSPPPASTSHS